MKFMDISQRAALYSKASHLAIGQTRKYTGEPYHTHPAAVAWIVRSVGGTPNMVAAAYLHDVVEDTHITLDQLSDDFGFTIADMVDWLSDLQTPEDGNRATRKKRERDRLAMSPPEVQTIKLADLIHNSRSIFQHDPEFAQVYLKEKRAILEVMTKGHSLLYQKAWDIIHKHE